MNPIEYFITRTLVGKGSKVLQPAEQVRFATGLKLDENKIIITELLPTPAKRSIVHAAPSPAGVARLQNRLLDLGQDIEAQFHSHPGTGPEATHPSRTDLNMARRWENGAPFIGAIFSSDGRYVRFFNHKQESRITIYGTNYTELEPGLFELHDPTMPPEEITAGVGDGPARTAELVEPGTDRER